ncbi:MAG: hypothetical protein WC817_04315 [Patescibacteria group bacterium]|jgi:tetratricopeptide (TPR) repeat protein
MKKIQTIVAGLIVLLVAGAFFVYPYAFRYWNTRLNFPASLSDQAKKDYLNRQHDLLNHPGEWGKNEAGLYNQIGILRAAFNDYSGAANAFIIANKRDAHDPRYLSNLGRMYVLQGKYKEAIGAYMGVYKAAPQAPEYWLDVATIYVNDLHDTSAANDFYADAVTKSGQNLNVVKAYAVFLETVTKDYASAIKYWQILADKSDQNKAEYELKVQELKAKISQTK